MRTNEKWFDFTVKPWKDVPLVMFESVDRLGSAGPKVTVWTFVCIWWKRDSKASSSCLWTFCCWALRYRNTQVQGISKQKLVILRLKWSCVKRFWRSSLSIVAVLQLCFIWRKAVVTRKVSTAPVNTDLHLLMDLTDHFPKVLWVRRAELIQNTRYWFVRTSFPTMKLHRKNPKRMIIIFTSLFIFL